MKKRRNFHLGLWRPAVDEAVDWEIAHHLQERIDELVAGGMTREEAETEARRTFGDLSRVQRQLRQIDGSLERRARLANFVETVVQDIRYGLRAVRLNPVFSLGVILTLGLGLGANVAMFTVIDALMLRPLPYHEPHELVELKVFSGGQEYGIPYMSWPQATAFRERQRFLDVSFMHGRRSMLYTGGAEPLTVTVQVVTPEFEETLGVQPLLGRGLQPDDGAAGATPVAVLDHAFWSSALGANPGVLQKSIVLDGILHTIVGVMPRGFKFPVYSTTVAWVPLPASGVMLGDPVTRPVGVLGRVRGDLTAADAHGGALSRALFTETDPANGQFVRLVRFGDDRARAVRESIILLAGAVGFILLVACVNVINLLLVRATTRTRELAVRLALGASRMRLLRQLATESLALSLLGGVLALVIALLALRAVSGMMPDSIIFLSPYAIEIERRALVFAFALAVACGLLLGLGPAIAATRRARAAGDDLTRYAARNRGKTRVRGMLVASEVALSVLLLVGAGLLLNSFVRLTRVDPGFRMDNLAVLITSVTATAHPDPEERGLYLRRLEERIEALPGVEAATITYGLPPTGGGFISEYALEPEGQAPMPSSEGEILPYTYTLPDYFQVTGARLLAGRAFTTSDDRKSGNVIIDEDLAARLWPGQSPLGKRFRLNRRPNDPWLTVVGVMGDLKLMGPDDRRADFEVMYPFDYSVAQGYLSMAIRTVGDPRALLSSIRSAVHEIDPNQPIHDIAPARALYAASIDMPRFLVVLVATLAVLALVLAGIGIFGVLAYAVSQRSHEFGVRLALGARAADLRRTIMTHGFTLAALGAAAGLAGALALSR
ncbi:MAG: ADOP family duplicated permease, partial [Longimicrobiales bacterium]